MVECLTQHSLSIKTVAGERKPLDTATKKGLLLQYELYLQKEGYGEKCSYNSCIRILLNTGADPYNLENLKGIIAKKKVKNVTKMQMPHAYDAMVRMLKLSWDMPHYSQEEILPFIPDEKELDALILGAKSKRMAVYLQTLKETMADPTEALRIEWTDHNGSIITKNHPFKNHYPRPIEVSTKLIAQLNSMPKISSTVFSATYQQVARNYCQLRKKIARTLCNPRIMKISLVTFRRWGATMTYNYMHNILLVKKLLGNKNIKNTMKYIQLIEFKDSEIETATATTVEKARKLGEAGFQKFDEFNGIHLYGKPKRFVSLA